MDDALKAVPQFTHYVYLFGIPLVFLVIVAYVFRPGSRGRYKDDANLPFEDDDEAQDGGDGKDDKPKS